MKNRKSFGEAAFIPAAEWVRRLGKETTSFEVVKVVASEPMQAGKRRMEWDYVITLAVPPDNRRVDLFVRRAAGITIPATRSFAA